MKRVISAVLLMLLCLGICTYASVVTEKKSKTLIEILDKIESEINVSNFEGALSETEKLESEWEKDEKIFSSLAETALIDEVDISLCSIEKYILSEKTEEVIILIEECRTSLETISKRQRLSLENIL